MEALSTETTQALGLAGSEASFTAEESAKLVDFALSSLVHGAEPREPDYGNFSKAKPERVKTALVGVLALVVESQRTDADSAAVLSACEEAGWDAARSAMFVKKLEENRDFVRATVQHTGLGLDRIVDLDWRLDYHIRSSASGMAHQPVFIVSAKLKDAQGRVRTQQFTCNTVQMEELLARVQDAAKQVDRVVQGIQGSGSAGAAR